MGEPVKKEYSSPRHKLVRFFEHSRDQWKVKCREAKRGVKRLKNRLRWIELSRARWKARAQELEQENRTLLAQNEALLTELTALKKSEQP